MAGTKTQDSGPAPKAPPRLPSPVKTQDTGPAPKIISSKVPDRGPAPKAPPSVPRPSPGGDVQSGGGYGVQSARANAYKQTAAYKQAIVATFLHQPKAQASAILRGALSAPSYEGNLILKYMHENGAVAGLTRGGALSGPALEGSVFHPGHALDSALAAGGKLGTNLASTLVGGRGQSIANPKTGVVQSGLGPGDLATLPFRAGLDVGRAAIQKPAVLPNTAKGLGETALGAVPGLIEAVQHPGQAVKAMGQDYSNRYGPLLQGNDKAFINRIKNSGQGAAPEVLDALGVIGGVDATAGRAAVQLARTREALTGAKPGFLTRARPALRVSGNLAREQKLAHGAMKITAQRAEDRIRAALKGRGEIHPKHGEVTPIFGKRAQRIDVSGVASRVRTTGMNMLNREVRGRGSAQGAIARLGRWEKRAFPIVVEGNIPLRSGPKAAIQWIDRRIAQITSHRLENAASFGNKIPPHLVEHVDELHLLTKLRANVDKWLTPKLAATVDREGARAVRIEGASARIHVLHPTTAEARRLRAQGEALGIEHPYERFAKQIKVLQAQKAKIAAVIRNPGSVSELQSARAAVARIDRTISDLHSADAEHLALSEYSGKVRKAAEKVGLPSEPGYFHHQPYPKTDFGAYTTGMGHAAMPGPKRSEFKLFKGGAMDRSLQAYVDGLAHSIKLPHQWRLVDEQIRRAIVNPSARAIHDALGAHKSINHLTGFELQQALLHEGYDLKNLRFIQPGRLEAGTLHKFEGEASRLAPEVAGAGGRGAPTPLEESSSFYTALQQDAISQPGNTEDQHFLSGVGVRAVPNTVYQELLSGTHPSGGIARAWGKLQGATGALILAGSPSFVIMNTLAEGLVALASTRGTLFKDMLSYPMWMRSLAPEEKQLFHERVRAYSGSRNYFRTDKLGSTAQSDLARSWRELQHHGIVRLARSANPVAVLFHTQDAISNTFRHAAFFSQVKRQALANIGKNTGLAVQAFEAAQHTMRLTPKGKLANAIRAEMQSIPALEEAGRHVLEVLGDYTRYTARERRLLNNRGILFYGFLRYATKTLLYTLPLHHPIIVGLTAELGKLHNDEVRKLLGGVDLPWAYSRLFFKGKDGKLTSIDTLRASPVGSTVTDVTTQGIRGLGNTVLPEVGLLLDEMYGQTPSGGKVPQNIFSLLNGYLSMSYPYRAFTQAHFGLRSQQADSIPFLHERPQNFKTPAAQQYQAAKEQASGPLSQKMLGAALGVYPKPDNSQVIAAHRAQLAAHKKKKGGPVDLFQGGSGGQDLFQSGAGGTDLFK